MRFAHFLATLALSLTQPAFAESSPAGSVEVLQATAVFGRDPALRYLQAGVSTCVVVAIMDPDTRTSYFAHIDAGVDVEKSLRSAIARFEAGNIKPSKLRAHIAGGWEGWSNQQSEQARKSLKKMGVRVVAYEPPLDIGYTIKDDQELRLPPASARGRAVRSYRFDVITQRLNLVPAGEQKMVGQPTEIRGLTSERLPTVSYKEESQVLSPPPVKKPSATVK